MGLDVYVYTDLKRVNASYKGEDRLTLYPEYDQGDGLAGTYRAVETGHFHAGSYSGYNYFRNQLTQFAYNMPAKDLWESSIESGPFYEIINFTDCDGHIGPTTSAKLYNDFEQYYEKAKTYDSDIGNYSFKGRYENFMNFFKIASENNGVVIFA